MILSIAKREFRSMFLSPMAWVVLAVIQVIVAWSFCKSIGKYLGLLFFIISLLFLLTLMPLSLNMGTDLDLAKLSSGVLGLFLMLAAFSAAGLYMSSLTDNPMIAAISTFGLLLLLWIIDTNSGGAIDGSSSLSYLSLHTHFSALLRGMLNTRDVAYFLLFTFGFIVLTIRQLETQRLQS
jgi:ABC-2 type transport system permease protein